MKKYILPLFLLLFSSPVFAGTYWNVTSSSGNFKIPVYMGNGASFYGGLIGEIKMYVSVSTPTHWLVCHGQSISTSTYSNLYAIIGYTFGGSGANFSLPDLRGRAPIGQGSGTGLSSFTIGTSTGTETISVGQMPGHTHETGTYADGQNGGGLTFRDTSAATSATSSTGSGNKYRPPEVVVNFIIYAGQ